MCVLANTTSPFWSSLEGFLEESVLNLSVGASGLPWSQPSPACRLVCTCPLFAQPWPAQDPGEQEGRVPSCGGRAWEQVSVLAGSCG